MAIPSHFIDEVVSRTDLVDLIGGYVHLQQKGRDYWGLCPFHLEKSPSFHVVPSRGWYKCFGCGKSGGAINFVRELENLPFVEAVEFLAKRAGMTMPEQQRGDGRARALREKLMKINTVAARFFYHTLYEPVGAEALHYLLERGLTKKTITRFGLGFAPNRWDSLILAMQEHSISQQDLLECGLVVQNEKGNIYDRFRNRVMFPIINFEGNVIGFGGRVMDDSLPKYQNSPETPIFDKSRTLFGLNYAKKSKSGVCLLTEGYMDTISLHQAGFDGAVGSLGTALTEGHAKLMSKFFKECILAYDKDDAGVKATQRGIPILEKAGINVRVLQMEKAKDPDEYIKKFGADSFAHLISQSMHNVEYRLEQMRAKYDFKDMAQKVDYMQEVAVFLATMPSSVQREIYAGKVAIGMELTKEAVLEEVEKQVRIQNSRDKKQLERKNLMPAQAKQPAATGMRYENVKSASAEEGLLRVLELEPQLMPKVLDLTESMFSSPLLGRVFEQMKSRFHEGASLQVQNMAEFFSSGEMNHLIAVMEKPEDKSKLEEAMYDYLKIMEEEMERLSLSGDDLLLAKTNRVRER